MFHRFFAGLIGLAAFSAPAFSTDLNIQSGEWELNMKADVFGTVMDESVKECTTPEDTTKSAREFVTEMLAESNCSIGAASHTVNIYSGSITCSSQSPFSRGDFSLQYSPTMLAIVVDFSGRGDLSAMKTKMSMLSQRVGPCPTR